MTGPGSTHAGLPGPVARESRAGRPAAVAIRPADARDTGVVVALDVECFGSSAWSAASWADEFDRLSEDRRILVAGGDAVVGYVVLTVPADERDPVDLTRIAVAPGARRTGVGERLLAAALAAVEGRTVLLEVAEGNEAAIGLYRRAGFGEISRRRGYYGADGDALILRRPGDAPSDDVTGER